MAFQEVYDLDLIHIVEGDGMRTNIVLDDDLVEKGLRLTGARTKKELVHRALEELVERHARKDLMDLAGRIEFSEGYDHKRQRELRTFEDPG